MIIGNGDIASVIQDKEGYIFFASGVSNSQGVHEQEYKKEIQLLLDQNSTNYHLVYFSSLGVLDGDSRYYKHKREMERLVKLEFPHHTIIRLGNITWGKNPHTLINYLRDHPNTLIKEEYRYICDKDEFRYWMKRIPEWSCEMNIVGERLHVRDVAKRARNGYYD